VTSPTDARVEWLDVAGDRDAWRACGLVVGADGLVALHGTCLRIGDDTSGGGGGLRGWALSGIDPATTAIDGVATTVVDPLGPVVAEHALGAIGLDHVVVTTDSLERTCGEIADVTGAPLKRVREVGAMRQGFHRVGRLVVEVVERPELAGSPTSLWGLVLDVTDLDAAVGLLGPERIGPPKDAVQPGRRIATVRLEAGLALPVALMTPA
jgi:hypothetical protein